MEPQNEKEEVVNQEEEEEECKEGTNELFDELFERDEEEDKGEEEEETEANEGEKMYSLLKRDMGAESPGSVERLDSANGTATTDTSQVP